MGTHNTRTECSVVVKNNKWDLEQLQNPSKCDNESIIRQPQIMITVPFSNPHTIRSIPTDPEGEIIPTDIDIGYRINQKNSSPDSAGVLSLTNRLTGEYIIEGTVVMKEIHQLTSRGKAYADETNKEPFTIKLVYDNGDTETIPQELLVVHSFEGDLLRDVSLIPNDVKI